MEDIRIEWMEMNGRREIRKRLHDGANGSNTPFWLSDLMRMKVVKWSGLVCGWHGVVVKERKVSEFIRVKLWSERDTLLNPSSQWKLEGNGSRILNTRITCIGRKKSVCTEDRNVHLRLVLGESWHHRTSL